MKLLHPRRKEEQATEWWDHLPILGSSFDYKGTTYIVTGIHWTRRTKSGGVLGPFPRFADPRITAKSQALVAKEEAERRG